MFERYSELKETFEKLNKLTISSKIYFVRDGEEHSQTNRTYASKINIYIINTAQLQ